MNLTEIQQTVQMQAIIGFIEIAVMVFILIFLIYLMLRLSAILRIQDNEHTINEKIAEKRMDIYEMIAVKLFDMLCFFLYTGNWMEISPVELIRLKRDIEKDMNIYGPVFGDDLINKLQEFNKLCFVSPSGWEHDVKIKSLYELREKHQVGWQEEWMGYFDTKNVVEAGTMKEKYIDLMAYFRNNLALS